MGCRVIRWFVSFGAATSDVSYFPKWEGADGIPDGVSVKGKCGGS